MCSLYLPPSAPVERGDLRLARDLPSPLILKGDFNGGHPMWRDNTINSRGVLLASFIEYLGLGILNRGDMTYFHHRTGTFAAKRHLHLLNQCTAGFYLECAKRFIR